MKGGMEEWKDGWRNGRMEGWKDGWRDVGTDG